MSNHTFNISGLNTAQVKDSREKFGENKLEYKKENTIWEAIKNLVKEPMILMLISAASIRMLLAAVASTCESAEISLIQLATSSAPRLSLSG